MSKKKPVYKSKQVEENFDYIETTIQGCEETGNIAQLFKEKQADINNGFQQLDPSNTSPQQIIDQLSGLIENLAGAVDLRRGIERKVIPTMQDKVLLRDCRHQNESPNDEFRRSAPADCPEAWLETMAGITRGAIKLGELSARTLLLASTPGKVTETGLEKFINRATKDYNGEVLALLKRYQSSFLHQYGKLPNPESKKNYKNLLQNFEAELITLIQQKGFEISGIAPDPKDINKEGPPTHTKLSKPKDIAKALDTSRNFTNLEDQHLPILSISRPIEALGGSSAFTLSKPLTKKSSTIKKEYTALSARRWFKERNPIEQNLTAHYKAKITDDKHIVSSQLNFLPGIHNGYIEFRGTINPKNSKITPATKMVEARSGTMAAYQVGDETERLRLTALNIQEVQVNLEGEKAYGLTPHISVLNNASEQKSKIVPMVEAAVNKVNTNNTMLTVQDPHTAQAQVGYHQAPVNKLAFFKQASNIEKHIKKAIDIAQDGASTEVNKLECKSGKDRTALIAFNNFIRFLKQGLNLSLSQEKEFANAVSDMDHHETLAGLHGGTRGVHALKTSGIFLKNSFKAIGKLIGMSTPLNAYGLDEKFHQLELSNRNILSPNFELKNVSDDKETPNAMTMQDTKIPSPTVLNQEEIEILAKGVNQMVLQEGIIEIVKGRLTNKEEKVTEVIKKVINAESDFRLQDYFATMEADFKIKVTRDLGVGSRILNSAGNIIKKLEELKNNAAYINETLGDINENNWQDKEVALKTAGEMHGQNYWEDLNESDNPAKKISYIKSFFIQKEAEIDRYLIDFKQPIEAAIDYYTKETEAQLSLNTPKKESKKADTIYSKIPSAAILARIEKEEIDAQLNFSTPIQESKKINSNYSQITPAAAPDTIKSASADKEEKLQIALRYVDGRYELDYDIKELAEFSGTMKLPRLDKEGEPIRDKNGNKICDILQIDKGKINLKKSELKDSDIGFSSIPNTFISELTEEEEKILSKAGLGLQNNKKLHQSSKKSVKKTAEQQIGGHRK